MNPTIKDKDTDYPPPPALTTEQRAIARQATQINKLISAVRECESRLTQQDRAITVLLAWKQQHINDLPGLTQRIYELEREVEMLRGVAK